MAPCSPPGDVVGKVTTGYQAWFTCEGDGSPIGGWWHWAPDRCAKCCCKNNGVVSWPAMHYYPKGYDTGFGRLNCGRPAQLYSNWDEETIHAQFRMMADAQIDTAAFQRFNPCGGEGPIRDATTPFVQRASQATGVKWYCMYDVSGWDNMATEMKNDWITKMSAYVNMPGYAFQNGKPVVCIWGFGFNDGKRSFTKEMCLEVIRWFKEEAKVYLIGGVPTWWRRGDGDSRPDFKEVYHAFDMLSPWMVGRASKLQDLEHYFREANRPDQEECEKHGIDYQPCVMPGDLSEGARLHGDFYWRHWYNTARLGCAAAYVSMFDEYNEGNQIAPTAENKDQQPPDFPHPALDEDGVACTADYYLRVTRDAGAMFKGCAPLTPMRPTEPWPGRGRFNTPPRRDNVPIRARANGMLVCAEANGKQPLVSNRTDPGPWERFTVETVELLNSCDGPQQSRVRIKACNGKYLIPDMCNKEKPGILMASGGSPGDNETFVFTDGDGSFSLLASNGKFVQASDGGNGPLVAWAPEAGWWESFEFVE